jgi:SRSO17 transposase
VSSSFTGFRNSPALEAGAPPGVVLMDAGYGADTSLRSALAGLGLAYVAGVQPHTFVWTRANPPPPVSPWSEGGRPTSRMVRDPRTMRFSRRRGASGSRRAAGSRRRGSPWRARLQ